jgi:DNA uptake protein ComE-like DNA-binding protein
MAQTVNINLANHDELLELRGLTSSQADAILKFRAEHGPIGSASELQRILGQTLTEEQRAQADFSPAFATAPEAPGA